MKNGFYHWQRLLPCFVNAVVMLMCWNSDVLAEHELDSNGFRQHGRVICVGSDCVLRKENSSVTTPVLFGTLFKISRIENDQCLVYGSETAGWLPLADLMSLSNAELLPVIQSADVTDVEREFALGSYHLRRNLLDAKLHFEATVKLDPEHDQAWSSLLHLYESMGDSTSAANALARLREFPSQETLILTRELRQGNVAVFARCSELMEVYPRLKSGLAVALLNTNDPQNISQAHRLADEAFRAEPNVPSIAFAVALCCQAIAESSDEPELRKRANQMAVAFAVKALALDHHGAKAFELLAQLLQQSGKQAAAIRTAQGALKLNPRSHFAASLIAEYADAVSNGELFRDATGTIIPPGEIQVMPEIARGLSAIRQLELSQDSTHAEEEMLRLHGETMVPCGMTCDESGRDALHLDPGTNVSQVKSLVTTRTVAFLNTHIDTVVLPLAQAYAVEFGKQRRMEEERHQSDMYIALDNSPIVLHGELDLDRKYYPSRANVRIARMLQQEAAEIVDLKEQMRAQQMVSESERSRLMDVARRDVLQRADRLLDVAYFSLPSAELRQFCQAAGKQLQTQLQQNHIHWQLPKWSDGSF